MSILHRPASMSILGLVTSRPARDRLHSRAQSFVVSPPRAETQLKRRDVNPGQQHRRRKARVLSPLDTLAPPPRPAGSFPEVRLSPPRGWYHDPLTAGMQRRWDGLGWTAELKSL